MRSDRERLADARTCIDRARDLGAGSGAQDLAAPPATADAILHALAVVGEALGHLPGDLKSLAPGVRWRAIKELRNLLVHSYWRVDLALIAGVVEDELPGPDAALAVLADHLDRADP